MAKILIVDDEAKIRRILQLMLSDVGYETATAESGEVALDSVRESPPDLVLLDMRMPGIDGLETLRRLQEICPAAQVIIMTAFGTRHTARKAMRSGAYDYVNKPFDNYVLLGLVDRALGISREASGEGSARDGDERHPAHSADPLPPMA